MQRPYLAIVGVGLPLLIFGLQELKVIEKTLLLWAVTFLGAALVGYGLWPYGKRTLGLVRHTKWRSPIQWPVASENKPTPLGSLIESRIAPTSDPITEEQLRTLAVYQDILDRDKNNLDRLLLVWHYESEFARVTELGGWIDFGFDVFNGSILTTTVGNRVDGYIVFQRSHQLHDKVYQHSDRALPHGGGDRIFIRQKLLPEEAKVIIDGALSENGMEPLFDFSGVSIFVDAKTPLGFKVPAARLKIDPLQKYHIWLDPQSVYPEKLILRWERIKHE